MTEALEAHLRRQIEHSRRFFWQRLRWRVVRGYLPPDSTLTVVDVGAGAGLLGDFLARDRPQATYEFIEPIDTLREFLRGRYGERADVANHDHFDEAGFVTLLDVLEHQEDDKTFLQDLVGKMRPGSMLLLTVPALQSLWSQWDVALGHFRRYDKNSLLTCTEGLPLSICEVSLLFPELVPLGILRARRKRANLSTEEYEDAAFPDLPGFVNDALYSVGALSLSLRRHWPTGTSLFLAARVSS